MSYRSYESKRAPVSLRNANGTKVLEELGGEKDVQIDVARQVTLANFPDKGPSDALPLVGGDRLLPRAVDGFGFIEAEIAYRERLRTAWDALGGWAYAGSHGAVLRALARGGFPNSLAAGSANGLINYTVVAKTTGNINFVVSGGVGPARVFTVSPNPGAALVVDTVTLAAGNLVLFASQTDGTQNGILRVQQTDAFNTIFTRYTGADSNAEISRAQLVTVSGGAVGRGVWVQTATAWDIDVLPLSYARQTFPAGWVNFTVRATTTGAIPACDGGGPNGPGHTITGHVNGALPPQDGVTLALNDRVLVPVIDEPANDLDPQDFGIYTVTNLGSPSTKWVLTRATDYDTASPTEVRVGAIIMATEGIANGGVPYVLSSFSGVMEGGVNVYALATQAAINGPIIFQRTRRFSYLLNGDVLFGTHPGWTFDGSPPSMWNQFGLVFPYDVPGLVEGSASADLLNRLVSIWKPGKARFMGTTIMLAGPWWDFPLTAAWGVGGRIWGDGVTTGTTRFIPP